MKTHLAIGSSPWGETCAQLGSPNFEVQVHVELAAFEKQLVRHATANGHTVPKGLTFEAQAHQHDFGTYYELYAVFEEGDQQATEVAYWIEGNLPEKWDDLAKSEISHVLPS